MQPNCSLSLNEGEGNEWEHRYKQQLKSWLRGKHIGAWVSKKAVMRKRRFI